MTQEFPKAPGAVIMSATGNYWVEESAKRVSEKLEDAKGGIGTDDGLVEFVGLESTGKPGADGLASYVLRLSPMYIVGVRSMSESGFENTLRAMQPQNPMEMIFGQLFGGGREPESEGGGHTSPEPRAVNDKLDLAEECCCGHPAGSHDRSKDVVRACLIDGCDCTVFHVHGSADG